WILLDFGAPRDVDAIWLDTRLTAHLESSDDGVHFKPFLTMPRPTFELFPAQRARYFRVLFGGPANKPEHWAVRELKLGCRAEVERHIQFAAKRALNLARPTVPFQRDEIAPALQPLAALPTDRPLASPTLIDLTEKVSADGQLDWDVPPGRWRIVWLRRSIASGMEVAMGLPDYLSAAATREDFEKGMNKLGQAAGAKAGKVLRYHHEDNNEIHSLYNWTPAMLDEFQRRRGYDARRYLATLAGEIVDSVEITDRFLNDLRRTVADCVAENHYAQWTALTHAAGLLTRCEAGGPYHPRVLCHDGLMNLARVDLMEGEFWHDATWTENWRTNLTDKLDAREGAQNHSVKQVASASHLYGKPIVDMESLTSFNYWSAAPRDFLLPANIAFCEGVNHMSVHGSDTTAAAEGAPGTVFVGSHFNDKNTWWPHVGAFVNYIHRCCAVLQRGRFVADVLYYIGDECPALVLSKHLRASLGFGYDYDECNTEILLTRLSVQAGRLVTPDGMSYRLLVLPERPFLTVPVARKIRELVQAGATVLGPKPVRTPGLTGYPRCDAELKVITAELWDTGKVIADKPEKTVLATQGVPVDFAFTGGQPDALLDFIHRQDGDAELYFVINRRNRTEHVECAFRVTGKRPELWNAVDGSRRDAPAYRIANGATTVPLELPAYGSTFVIFRNPTTELTHAAAKTAAEQPVQDLT
ncbi:MAG: hypothetical protein FJ388_17095, partial [Verrucomicrobia bacterium]|nr:hypothetical protein [Verrucomicrobiota bacterium]